MAGRSDSSTSYRTSMPPSTSTSFATRSGCVAAKRTAMWAPREWPTSTAFLSPK